MMMMIMQRLGNNVTAIKSKQLSRSKCMKMSVGQKDLRSSMTRNVGVRAIKAVKENGGLGRRRDVMLALTTASFSSLQVQQGDKMIASAASDIVSSEPVGDAAKKTTVFVAGATGKTGAHVVKSLLDRGKARNSLQSKCSELL